VCEPRPQVGTWRPGSHTLIGSRRCDPWAQRSHTDCGRTPTAAGVGGLPACPPGPRARGPSGQANVRPPTRSDGARSRSEGAWPGRARRPSGGNGRASGFRPPGGTGSAGRCIGRTCDGPERQSCELVFTHLFDHTLRPRPHWYRRGRGVGPRSVGQLVGRGLTPSSRPGVNERAACRLDRCEARSPGSQSGDRVPLPRSTARRDPGPVKCPPATVPTSTSGG
jgi:hypothetical protein